MQRRRHSNPKKLVAGLCNIDRFPIVWKTGSWAVKLEEISRVLQALGLQDTLKEKS